MKKLAALLMSLILALSLASPTNAATSRSIGGDKVPLSAHPIHTKFTGVSHYSYDKGDVSLKIHDHQAQVLNRYTAVLVIKVYAKQGNKSTLLRTINYYPKTSAAKTYVINVDKAPRTPNGNVQLYATYTAGYWSTVYVSWRD